jgi:hypothetical protein
MTLIHMLSFSRWKTDAKADKFYEVIAPRPCDQGMIMAVHEDLSKSFRTGRLERDLQMVPLSATVCSCIGIL